MFCVERVSISSGQRLRAALSVVTQDTGTIAAKCQVCCSSVLSAARTRHDPTTQAGNCSICSNHIHTSVSKVDNSNSDAGRGSAAQQAPDKLIHY